MPLLRRLLPALLLLAVAPGAGAQPVDSTAARPIFSRMEEAPAPGRSGCGPRGAAGASPGGGGGCVLPDRRLELVPLETTVGGAIGGGEGLVSLTADIPLAFTHVDGVVLGALSAEAALGAGTGLRAGAGLYAGAVVGESQALRLGVRAGGWAERSPVGNAYGPAVTASARIYLVRVVAGAVVAGAPMQYGRVVLEVPLAISDTEALPFAGIGLEARRYADTGTMVWTFSFTLGL